jgi:subtilase family serine protease
LYALGAWASDLKSPEQAPANATVIPPQAVDPDIVTRQGTVITPESSVPRPGVNHTNYHIFAPAGMEMGAVTPNITTAENPRSMACVYGVGTAYSGCVPSAGTAANLARGGWGAIALVDAYDDPTAASDLAVFSSHWGLPAANFKKVYANTSFGTLEGLTASCSGIPANGNITGWDLEEALDIEWAHAMAPSAQIILVEACSNSNNDLFFAELVAAQEVKAAGGGDISNSWGCQELICQTAGGQQNADNYFYRYYYDHITYFASAGDAGAEVIYPSSSPWVISAGGTTVNRNSSLGFVSESCWAGSGGGFSSVETWLSPPNIFAGMGPWTDYQWRIFGSGNRSTPDMSFNADPNSGVWVYDTDEGGGWYIVGGTSVSSPALAGIVNASNNRLGMTPPGGGYYKPYELDLIYAQLLSNTAYKVNFYDVTTGSNGHAAGVGYDQCTGVGSPRGHLGK